MKLRPASYLAIILALFIVNTGFAQAELLLCQNKCEQSQLQKKNIPECCRDKNDADHSFVLKNDHDMSPGNCPHVDSNSKISDSLIFLACSTKVPGPPKAPTFVGTISSPLALLPDVRALSYQVRSGLSPPGLTGTPTYLLNCTFLI